jgi:hypothetical protein
MVGKMFEKINLRDSPKYSILLSVAGWLMLGIYYVSSGGDDIIYYLNEHHFTVTGTSYEYLGYAMIILSIISIYMMYRASIGAAIISVLASIAWGGFPLSVIAVSGDITVDDFPIAFLAQTAIASATIISVIYDKNVLKNGSWI